MADDEDYFLAPHDQRVFSAGIRRKRVPFVPSSETLLTTGDVVKTKTEPEKKPGPNAASKYLSIVLPEEAERVESSSEAAATASLSHADQGEHGDKKDVTSTSTATPGLCDVCNLPLDRNPDDGSTDRPHEASIAHQVCLTHSHPPSHLDRTRPGLRYLASYGWDPDSRLGLGAPGREGIREPLKARIKEDTAGLGVPEEEKKKKGRAVKEARVEKLNAKQVRQREMEAKKRGEKLREMFYRSEDVQKYLGDGI
ncbi:hypothetical protein VTN00DRAFT_9948 [Thermoascus crustaceus]|uniref:uncharacterized protein n=1 Tax=Thermoascus crustaceus TaxID=5088 RepID=UPI00374294EA